jgi:hypothetical protein
MSKFAMMANFASVVRGGWARRNGVWWRQEFWWGGLVVIGLCAEWESSTPTQQSRDSWRTPLEIRENMPIKSYIKADAELHTSLGAWVCFNPEM